MSARRPGVYPSRVLTRFRLTDVSGETPLVDKRGDHDALAREVAALTQVAGAPWAPALIGHGPGWMRLTRLPGAPRAISAVAEQEARRLGVVLRTAHETRRARHGGLWTWEAQAATLGEYRRLRAQDTERALEGGPDAGLARRALAAADGIECGEIPFRMLHGDLVEANVVWGPDGPGLVDWEFSRMGDPAEDLAYLIEANALPQPVAEGVLEGYGLPGMGPRVEGWRALAAADAGAWYRAQGLLDEASRLLARARALC